MTEPLKAPRGTVDILPGAIPAWERMEAAAREHFARYRFQEIRTPAFEATELFARGMGEATDVVSKEMYTFSDRGDRSLTLRPEGTAGVVRAFVEHRLDQVLGLPAKLWYAGPMFRYERPQKGRQRQFHQIGVEVLGSADPRHDAEAIELAVALFAALGLGGLEVQLNSLGDPTCRPAYTERLKAHFAAHRDANCPTCQERMNANPLRVLDCKVAACKALNAAAPSIQDVLCDACRTHQDRVLAYLAAVGVRTAVTPTLVRGLDYYTRTVFEIVSASEELGSQNTLCAGGRYDGLVEQLGGPPTPGVGWAFGQERLALVMGEQPPDGQLAVYLAPMGEAAEREAFRLAAQLRRDGIPCELGSGKLDKQLKHAARHGARFAGVIGDSELAEGVVQLKDLATRNQERVPVAELAARLCAGVLRAPEAVP